MGRYVGELGGSPWSRARSARVGRIRRRRAPATPRQQQQNTPRSRVVRDVSSALRIAAAFARQWELRYTAAMNAGNANNIVRTRDYMWSWQRIETALYQAQRELGQIT